MRGELRGDRPPFDQLHHQEEAVAVLSEVVHGHDVRVAQPRGGPRFARNRAAPPPRS